MAKGNLPTYRKHANGQAYISHSSIPRPGILYLGKYDSEISHLRYQQAINRILRGLHPQTVKAHQDAAVAAVALLYMDHVETYYVDDSGKQTEEVNRHVDALRVLNDVAGNTIAAQFGPNLLLEVREAMIDKGWARSTVNKHIGRVKRLFRWACQHEHIPPDIYHRLTCVDGLRRGRSRAKEPEPVAPVPWEDAEAILPFVSPTVSAMIQVQFYCGMRPQDAYQMRGVDIDRGAEIWIYRPPRHKNAWRGQVLVKAIPLVAQKVLTPFLDRPADSPLFSPKESRTWYLENAPRKPRKTKRYPSEAKRVAENKRRAARRKSKIRDQYDASSYAQAVQYGIQRARKAGLTVPHWSPNQLRHGIATEIASTMSQQKAQRWLGHKNLATTDIYVEQQIAELLTIADEVERRFGRS